MKNGQVNGIKRFVYNRKIADYTTVSWMKDNRKDGKRLVYSNGVCR